MIVANGSNDNGDEFLLFGLSEANIRELKKGRPIKMTPHSHPGIPKGWTISIMYGETEQAIYAELKETGALEGALVKKDERLN